MQQPPFPPSPEQPSPFAEYPPYQGQPQPGYSAYPGQPGYSGYQPSPLQSPLMKRLPLKYGLIFGAILAARLILGFLINSAIARFVPSIEYQYHLTAATIGLFFLALTAIFTLIDWVIYFLAGLFTARRTRQVGSATIACLWANLCYFVVSTLLTGINVLYFLQLTQGDAAIRGTMMTGYLTNLGTSFATGLILLHLGLGTGIGALGGLLGKNLASRQAPPN